MKRLRLHRDGRTLILDSPAYPRGEKVGTVELSWLAVQIVEDWNRAQQDAEVGSPSPECAT